MDSTQEVYLGAWTNWSRGSAVTGATLTMTREYGNLLIAFTALFIPFVASRFWRILAVISHQYWSTPDAKDTIHHQRQIVLRNSSSPESGLALSIRLLWAWRSVGRRPWLRVLPILFLAFFSIAIFTAAGILSSKISTAGEVLLKGDKCQIPNRTQSSTSNTTNEIPDNIDTASYINNIANYAQQCYSNTTSGLLECSRFIINSIPTGRVEFDTPCPFKEGLCRRENSSIRLDTGHLNSNDIFGLNAPKDETLTFRYVVQCSPLNSINREFNVTVDNHSFTTYNYGEAVKLAKDQATNNYTYVVPDLASQYSLPKGTLPNVNYLVRSSAGKARDGDVTLTFLSGNGVLATEPTEDDWYRANIVHAETWSHIPPFKVNGYAYKPDMAASALGCVQQFQWCRDPEKGQCGNLEGRLDAVYSAGHWFNLTREDMEPERPVPKTKLGSLLIWAYFILIEDTTNLQGVIRSLGSASLASQNLITQGNVGIIQNNQWQLDVQRWWQILLAGFQARFVRTAQGPSTAIHTMKPASDYDWGFCHNQKIRSAQHDSFSILGLGLTYSIGLLIAIISFIIEPILRFLQKRGWYNQYAYLEWQGDSAIQLHRVAQEQLDNGQWSRCDERVPITRPDDILGAFDISNPEHPTLASVDDKTATEEAKPESASRDSVNEQPSMLESPPERDAEDAVHNTGTAARVV